MTQSRLLFVALIFIVVAGLLTVLGGSLPPVLRGEKISALAITEPSGGSDVANLQTTARRDAEHFVVIALLGQFDVERKQAAHQLGAGGDHVRPVGGKPPAGLHGGQARVGVRGERGHHVLSRPAEPADVIVDR